MFSSPRRCTSSLIAPEYRKTLLTRSVYAGSHLFISLQLRIEEESTKQAAEKENNSHHKRMKTRLTIPLCTTALEMIFA